MESYKKWRGVELTGIADLKDSLRGKTACVLASGPSFSTYDDSLLPESWLRVSINETIKAMGALADYWVLSDTPVVRKYARFCPPSVNILAMHQACQTIAKACPRNDLRTVSSEREPPKDYDNGYQFFSRRTVVIGAIEMLRYMGVRRIFLWGFDFFRTTTRYYYDDSKPLYENDKQAVAKHELPEGVKHEGERCYAPPNLRAGSEMVEKVRRSGLWKDMQLFCVASPSSQQQVAQKIDWEELEDIIRDQPEVDVAAPAKPVVKDPEPEPEPEARALVDRSAEELAAEEEVFGGKETPEKEEATQEETVAQEVTDGEEEGEKEDGEEGVAEDGSVREESGGGAEGGGAGAEVSGAGGSSDASSSTRDRVRQRARLGGAGRGGEADGGAQGRGEKETAAQKVAAQLFGR